MASWRPKKTGRKITIWNLPPQGKISEEAQGKIQSPADEPQESE
jgi:hypothetical protein